MDSNDRNLLVAKVAIVVFILLGIVFYTWATY
jgi:hypothetical protein